MTPMRTEGSNTATTVQILVISLDDSQRVNDIESELARRGLPWSRVAAVDGRRIPEGELALIADVHAGQLLYGRALARTEIGCLLSHRVAYREFLRGQAEWALMLEDDAFPAPGVDSFLSWLSRWRVTTPTIVECFSAGRVNDAPRSITVAADLSLVPLRTYPGFTVAYAINRLGAERALGNPGRVASRADWPAWAVDVDFWRTEPSVFSHGRPDQEFTSTMVRDAYSESRGHKAARWAQLLSGVTYVHLREHYPKGLGQYYRHAVLPTAYFWRGRLSKAIRWVAKTGP